MGYHEVFWATAAATAPVIALVHIVTMSRYILISENDMKHLWANDKPTYVLIMGTMGSVCLSFLLPVITFAVCLMNLASGRVTGFTPGAAIGFLTYGMLTPYFHVVLSLRAQKRVTKLGLDMKPLLS